MPVWNDIGQSSSALVQTLHGWWTAHRGDSDIPDRRALWPGDIVKLLPFIFIAEVERNPFRIRYRLVGTKAVAVTGFDVTGRYLDEFQHDGAEVPWTEYYKTVAETRQPLLGDITVPAKAGGTFRYEFGIFPLTLGGTEVCQFVAIEDYFGFEFGSAQWAR